MIRYDQQGRVIVTVAEVAEAERLSAEQRFKNMKFLRAREDLLTDADRKMIAKVAQECTSSEKWDNALAHPYINKMFQRGVLYFDA